MEKDYLISNSNDAMKGYDYYNNRKSINITQKYYDEHPEKQMPAEIIKDFLYWVASDEVPKSDDEAYYFCTDSSTELKYDPFHKDFGPLNLAMTHRFGCELTKVLFEKKDTDGKIYHYTSTNGEKMANSAGLMGAFMVIILQRTPEEAWEILKDYHHSITPFRDATAGIGTYNLTILEVLKGLEKAIELGWYNFKTFDVQEYEYYEKLDNGDLNWVIPGKICAFMGPGETNYDTNGLRCHTPEDYSKLFESLGVERIIRLNEKGYDKYRFEKFGFKHHDLFFVDGSTPSMEIVNAFIEIGDKAKGAIAVHGKAGLGRTGTLIGGYAMKRYGFNAAAFIGWIRLCRPGSVLGPQQHFLITIEDDMMFGSKAGSRFRDSTSYPREFSQSKKTVEMSSYDKITSKYGDERQAHRLLTAKKLRDSMKFR